MRAVQGLQHLRGIGVTFENANQVPALLKCLAGLGQLTELYIGGTETEVCLNLSSLKCIMSLHICNGVEFSHPPPKLTHYTIEGNPTSRMMSQLTELHNLIDMTLEENCGYEHLPTTLQKLSLQEMLLWEDRQGQLSAVLGSLAQLKTLCVATLELLTVELIHMLARLHLPHLQTFGFDLPDFTVADVEQLAFANFDTDQDCILVHVPFVVEKLSTAFPALEVFEVGSRTSGYQARSLMHLFDCTWMNQHVLPRLRGLTNRSLRRVQFFNIPQTCYLADIGCCHTV